MDKPVGFIGLGMMGFPMAQNLLKGGIQLQVYNRSKEKATPLLAQGAKLANTPSEALDGAEIVISMISNDKVLEELINGPNGIATQLKPGVIHLSMSTVGPETSKKLEEEHRARGAVYLAAPVSGRPEGAAAAKLFIFLAGETKAKERVKPLLGLLGQRTFDLGEDAEKANLYKLINNFMILSAIEALAEGFAVAEKNGLSPKLVGEILTESLFASPIYKTYAPLIAEGKFDPGFALDLGFKDIRLLQEVSRDSSVPMPFSDLLIEKMLTCMARGDDKKDWSCIASLSKEAANLK